MEDSRVSQEEDAQDNSDFDWVVRGVSRDPEKARFILLSRGRRKHFCGSSHEKDIYD